MDNLTIKSILYKIKLITTICLIFLIIGLINIVSKVMLVGLIFIMYSVICFMIFTLPLMVRYFYVKNVCKKSQLIEGEVVEKTKASFDLGGYLYKVRINNTNTILNAQVILNSVSEINVKDMVTFCYDVTHNEALIQSKIDNKI